MAREKEILRVVILDDGDVGEVRVTSYLPHWKAPGVYGHLLADIARHFEQILEEEGMEDGRGSMMGHFFRERESGPSPIFRITRHQRGPDKSTSPITEIEKPDIH